MYTITSTIDFKYYTLEVQMTHFPPMVVVDYDYQVK